MINVNNLSKRYGAQVLFDDVNLRFDPGKRYGIVGANGAGKSTFLRIVTGQEYADSGQVSIPTKTRVGTLTQDHFAFEDVSLMNVVMEGRPSLAAAFREKDVILEDPNADPHRIAELEEIIADNNGYVAEPRISEMLEGLGIPTEKHYQPMSVLSGGYKLRVLLAQCLFGDPEVLMLDEPTNHLDIFSIKWLEDYLCKYRGVVIVISHDREFLNNVCTNIVDIDYGTGKLYTGNYDQFLEAKAADEEMRRIEAEKAEKRISELQDFVDRFKAKASKARQAGSKQRQIERMEENITEPVYSSRISPHIKFDVVRPPGKQVLEVKNVSKSYGAHQVLKDVSFDVYRGDKIAILGPNGVGKSTLLKIVMDELNADGGEVEWGHETYPQYFSQDHHEGISQKTTPNDWLHNWAPAEPIGAIRGTLGNLLFSGDDVHKSTAALSGGEAARLVLAKLVLLKSNVLIMDEPTNHLDMESIEALVDALIEYEGTLLLVSHNRYVVEKIATKILEITPDGIDMFNDNFHAFIEKMGTDHLSYQVNLGDDVEAKPKKEKKEKAVSKDKQDRKARQAAKKAFKADAKVLLQESREYEANIEAYESELEEINNLFMDPDYFTKTDPGQVRKTDARKKELESQLEHAMETWEAVNLRIEELKEQYGITD